MKDLIKITQQNFNALFDIRYAGENNLTGKKIYSEAFCLLHPKAAELLQKAIELAKHQNYQIKIWDCFRPFEVQEFLFNKYKDFPGLFSNPESGTVPHCRGVAIDLTLTDANGVELEMGTDFDDTTKLAFHDCLEVSELAQKNRLILKEIMLNAGWDFYQNEWWHYQLFNPRDFPIVKHC